MNNVSPASGERIVIVGGEPTAVMVMLSLLLAPSLSVTVSVTIRVPGVVNSNSRVAPLPLNPSTSADHAASPHPPPSS